MNHRRIRAVAVVAALLFVAACGSVESGSPSNPQTDNTVASFACVQAMVATGLTSGSTVDEARMRLDALSANSSLADAEREHFGEMLNVLDGRDGADLIGDTLDSVPCSLP